MATFEATNRYPREIVVKFPDPRHKGKYQTQRFTAIFETVDRDELDAMIVDKKGVGALLDRVLVGTEGITDRDGNDIGSEAGVDLCKQNAIVSTAIRDEFWKSIQGSVKS